MKKYLCTKICVAIFMVICLPAAVLATGFKFRIKNNGKNKLAVFYRINEHSGDVKVKPLFSLDPAQMKEKEISLKKGDTIAFYGQDTEDQTSITIKRDYATLSQQKNAVYTIPIIIPEKTNTSFESL